MKVHKEQADGKTACGIHIRRKAPHPYTYWIYNHNIIRDSSGYSVTCKKCIQQIKKKRSKDD